MIRLLFIAFLLLAASSAQAKNLYVDGSNVDCDDTTTYALNDVDNPWCTIGRAAWGNASRSTVAASPSTYTSEAAQAGDTVYISAGEYSNVKPTTTSSYYVAFNPLNSGTSSQPITFQAVGTVTITQNGDPGLDGTATGRAVIGCSAEEGPGVGAPDYIHWKGFTLSDVDVNAVNGIVAFMGNGTYNPTGCTIEESTVNGGGAAVASSNNHPGIYLSRSVDTVVRNNTVYNWLNNGAYHMNGSGIMVYYGAGALIENNDVYGNGSGIFLKGGEHTNSTVRYNHTYGNQYNILFQYSSDGSDNYIYQNLVRCGIAGPDEHYGVWARDSSHDVYIVNNTVTGCTNAGIAISGGSSSSDLTVMNNIVYQTSAEVIGAGELTSASLLSADYNNTYSSERWSISGTVYTSLANWRTALGGCPGTGNDCGSIVTDPLFTNTGTGNYTLQSGSPALTLGRTITAIHGTSGQTIPAGAYITGNEVIGIDTETPPSGGGMKISAGSTRFGAGSMRIGSEL